jgi:hypothetical protein
MGASYDTQLLRDLGRELRNLTVHSTLEGMPERVKVTQFAWPMLFMGNTPEDYNELCEAVEKATKALLDMTSTLGDTLDAIAVEYEIQERKYGKDIESLLD